jgi:hypothetical protein
MRQQFSNQTFEYLRCFGTGHTFSEIDLDRVTFVGGVLGQIDDPDFGFVVRDVTATRCRANNCRVQGVRFEDVTVDGLTLTKMQQLGGCLFRHVTLKGKIGSIMTTPVNRGIPEETRTAMNASMIDYYRDVDWALDISEAEFSDADFYMVPGDLVRRDPETQFLMRREVIEQAGQELPNYPSVVASRFESTPFDSIVGVVPRRSKNFAEWLEQFEQVRKAGLAE